MYVNRMFPGIKFFAHELFSGRDGAAMGARDFCDGDFYVYWVSGFSENGSAGNMIVKKSEFERSFRRL